MRDIFGGEDEEDLSQQQPSRAIKEMTKSWKSVSNYTEKYLPDNTNSLNQNVSKGDKKTHIHVQVRYEAGVSESGASVEPEVAELANVSVEPSISQ